VISQGSPKGKNKGISPPSRALIQEYMNLKFESHQRPLPSRLERWRAEITEMRAASWPYLRISKWFSNEEQFKISEEAIRQFCLVRGIEKSEPTNKPSRARPRSKPVADPRRVASSTKPKKLFEYDDSQPIQTRRT